MFLCLAKGVSSRCLRRSLTTAVTAIDTTRTGGSGGGGHGQERKDYKRTIFSYMMPQWYVDDDDDYNLCV